MPAALLYVGCSETPLGAVYATDTASDPKVEIAGAFPEDTHPPIIYPIALTAAIKSPAADKFIEFVEFPGGTGRLSEAGFHGAWRGRVNRSDMPTAGT